jgi:hypothetical protein
MPTWYAVQWHCNLYVIQKYEFVNFWVRRFRCSCPCSPGVLVTTERSLLLLLLLQVVVIAAGRATAP